MQLAPYCADLQREWSKTTLEQADDQSNGLMVYFISCAHLQAMGACHRHQQHASSLQVGRTLLVGQHGTSADQHIHIKTSRRHTRSWDFTKHTALRADLEYEACSAMECKRWLLLVCETNYRIMISDCSALTFDTSTWAFCFPVKTVRDTVRRSHLPNN